MAAPGYKWKKVRPMAERFAEKYCADAETGCWLWTAHVNSMGYGMIGLPQQRAKVLAHRYSFELVNGPIAAGMLICHRCDTPRCVNPAHLFLGTHQDNMDDCARKGRKSGGRQPGEQHPRSRLTDEAVRIIKSSSDTHAALARRFDVTASAVQAVRQGKTWKHVN